MPEPPPSTTESQRVFISYARSDGSSFASRLATDLRTNGYEVFWDRQSIPEGTSFDAAIERGIRDSGVVGAVISKGSMRERSVCRDEVQFALVHHKSIVPLRLDPDPRVTSLLLARLNWIDFSRDYDAGLSAFLRYLAGEPAAAVPPPLATVGGRQPIDFSPEIARHATELTDPHWLESEIEAWLTRSTKRVMMVVAQPGAGKSALAASLCHHRPDWVIGVHFFTARNSLSLNPSDIIASLVAQLYACDAEFAAAVECRHPAIRRATLADSFRQLIVEPLRQCTAWPTPRLLILDSLDEAEAAGAGSFLDVLLDQAPDLPPNLRILCTTRPDASILERIGDCHVVPLDGQRSENLAAIRTYIAGRIANARDLAPAPQDPATLRDHIASVAAGNFLCARLLIDAVIDGTLSPLELTHVSPGLAAWYAREFRRLFPDIQQYARDYAPLLRALVAAKAPVPVSLLRRVCGSSSNASLEILARPLRCYLTVSGRSDALCYALFHPSLPEWLRHATYAGPYAVGAQSGQEPLVDACWSEYRESPAQVSAYTARHLPAHLADMHRWDEMEVLLHDRPLGLLNRWIEHGEADVGVICLTGLVEHLAGRGRTVPAAELATQLARVWAHGESFAKAEEWLAYTLARTSWARGRRARAIALHELASLHFYRSAHQDALRAYAAALWLCMAGVPRYVDEAAGNWIGLATVYLDTSRAGRARRCATLGARAAQRAGDIRHLVAAWRILAALSRRLGAYEAAGTLIAEALRQCNAIDLPIEQARLSTLNGWVQFEQATLAQRPPHDARASFEIALLAAHRSGMLHAIAEARLSIGWCLLVVDDAPGADEQFQRAGVLLQPNQHHDLWAAYALGLAALRHRRGESEAAHAGYVAVVDDCRRHGIPAWGQRAMVALGALDWHAGRRPQAEVLWGDALRWARQTSAARQDLLRAGIDACRADPKMVPR